MLTAIGTAYNKLGYDSLDQTTSYKQQARCLFFLGGTRPQALLSGATI